MWKNLSGLQKLLISIVILAIVPFAPELIFLVDLGGVELVFTFVVLYFKPILIRLTMAYQSVKSMYNNLIVAFSNSAIAQPRVFAVQGVFCVCAVVVTGSAVYASAFMFPALLLQPVLV